MYTDADIEMAEANATGSAVAAARKHGACPHYSAVGYHESFPERGLKPGQTKCTDTCGQVFDSEQAWYDAMDDFRSTWT